MKTTLSLAAGLALMVSAAAFAQATNPVGTSGPGAAQMPGTPQEPGNPKAARAVISAEDRGFIDKAAASGLAEVQEGQLAQSQSQSDKVKDFAQRMVTDHSAANDKLKSLGSDAGAEVLMTLDSADEQQLATLRKLQGAAFDKRYIHDQIAAHKAAIVLFKKEASSGSDPQLKQFAAATLPTIEEHLKAAEDLERGKAMPTD
jgi:putative membrane protein